MCSIIDSFVNKLPSKTEEALVKETAACCHLRLRLHLLKAEAGVSFKAPVANITKSHSLLFASAADPLLQSLKSVIKKLQP